MMTLSTLSALAPYLLSAVSLLVLLRTSARVRAGSKEITAVLSIVFCIWVIFGCGMDVIFYGVILLLVGLILYAARTFFRTNP
jgi:APA family basic amino acid/polyamine antiporter